MSTEPAAAVAEALGSAHRFGGAGEPAGRAGMSATRDGEVASIEVTMAVRWPCHRISGGTVRTRAVRGPVANLAAPVWPWRKAVA